MSSHGKTVGELKLEKSSILDRWHLHASLLGYLSHGRFACRFIVLDMAARSVDKPFSETGFLMYEENRISIEQVTENSSLCRFPAIPIDLIDGACICIGCERFLLYLLCLLRFRLGRLCLRVFCGITGFTEVVVIVDSRCEGQLCPTTHTVGLEHQDPLSEGDCGEHGESEGRNG